MMTNAKFAPKIYGQASKRLVLKTKIFPKRITSVSQDCL